MKIIPGDPLYDDLRDRHLAHGGEYIELGGKFYRAYVDNDTWFYVYIVPQLERDAFGKRSKHFRAPYSPEV